MRFHWTEKLLPFESVPKKNGFPRRNKILLKTIGLLLIAIMVSKKIWMEEYRFHLIENPLPLAVIKDSFNIFPRDGKTASSGRYIWDIGTKWFPLARKSVSTG